MKIIGFNFGQSAHMKDVNNVNWVPSMNLVYTTATRQNVFKENNAEEMYAFLEESRKGNTRIIFL